MARDLYPAVKDLEIVNLASSWIEVVYEVQSEQLAAPTLELTRKNAEEGPRLIELPKETSSLRISNLMPKSEYILQACATNAVPTKPIEFSTLEACVPSPPSSIHTIASINSIDIQWKSIEDCGSMIDLYDVQYTSDQIQWKRQNVRHIGDIDTLQDTVITDLISNTIYHFKIRSRNSIGFGVNSAILKCRTKAPVVPDSPEFLAPTNITITEFTVNWSLNAYDGGAPLIGFHLQIGNNTENAKFLWSEIAVIRLPPSQTHYTMTQLQHNTVYQVRIRSINRVGKSRYSDALSVQTMDFSIGQLVDVYTRGVLLASSDWYRATLVFINHKSRMYSVRTKEAPDQIIEIEAAYIRPCDLSASKSFAGEDMEY